jgi:hypothetical protein
MLAKPWGKLLHRRAELNVAAMFVFVTLAIGFASYQRLFSSFASYDDEGYVMISLRQFMAGGALYDQVYSQYGPAYYWLASLFHWVTDWPVTHDVTRIKTLAVWMSVSLLAAGWLYRVTRSAVISTMGLLFVSFHLERLAMEPGHPQELCLLAVAVCMFLATFVRGKSTDVRFLAGMGVATAVCFMTKVNVGLFLALSLSASLLFATRTGRMRNVLLGSVLAAMVVLPIVIGRHELFSWHGCRLPMLLTVSIALAMWASNKCRRTGLLARHTTDGPGDPSYNGDDHALRHVFYYWGTSISVSVIIAIGTLASGTTLSGLADGLLLQHMSFVSLHYHDPPIHALAPLAALVAVLVARKTLTETRWLRVVHVVAVVLIVGAVLRHLVETFQPLYHGSQDRGQIGLLASFFTPYVWIILLPVRSDTSERQAAAPNACFARLSLCLIAVLQPLIAYPVPGTQMAIGSLALVVALLTAIHDAVESLRRERHFLLPAGRGVVIGILTVLLITAISRDVYLWAERSRLPSLDLAGASRLRLPEETVAMERWTVEQLRERADTFLCLPSGHNSLYLWSGIEPPTGFNTTVWQDLLSDQRQREIIDAVSARQRVCVVVDHNEPASLRTHGPLLDFVRENFEPVAVRGSREIWQRRPAALVDPPRPVKLGDSRPL